MEKAKRRAVPIWRSLQVKYALTYIAIITAILALVNTYPVTTSQRMIFQSKQTSLQSQANVIASALAGPYSLSQEGVARVMEVLGDTGLSRVVVVAPAGVVLYDTAGPSTVGKYGLIYEVTRALQGQDEFRSDYAQGAFHSRAAIPVTYRGMTVGAVYVDEYDAEQGQLLEGVWRTLRRVSLGIAVGAILISLFFSGALTRRIGKLLGAIRIVREGEYSHRVQMGGGDELSQLAGEFNELTGRLQTTEEVRRRFVSDASHELKTPLASIRLLADSITQNEQIDPDTVRDFVGDIGQEAERLQRITEKLLTLTRMDAAAPVEVTAVEVAEVALRARHMLDPLAQAVKVDMILELTDDLWVKTNPDDLYQILFNLMENAIKYNLPGGHVWVFSKAQGDQAVIIVEDTGVGIPAEDIDKIFDRFYRVDKARSRAAGGTGLGLSIVRDTAHRLGGTVEARRGENGTSFVVTLPWLKEEQT